MRWWGGTPDYFLVKSSDTKWGLCDIFYIFFQQNKCSFIWINWLVQFLLYCHFTEQPCQRTTTQEEVSRIYGQDRPQWQREQIQKWAPPTETSTPLTKFQKKRRHPPTVFDGHVIRGKPAVGTPQHWALSNKDGAMNWSASEIHDLVPKQNNLNTKMLFVPPHNETFLSFIPPFLVLSIQRRFVLLKQEVPDRQTHLS